MLIYYHILYYLKYKRQYKKDVPKDVRLTDKTQSSYGWVTTTIIPYGTFCASA